MIPVLSVHVRMPAPRKRCGKNGTGPRPRIALMACSQHYEQKEMQSTGSCTRYECFFLRPLRKKIEEGFDENGKLILDCRICPYNRVSPCIGYCIAALRREVSVAYEDRQGSA